MIPYIKKNKNLKDRGNLNQRLQKILNRFKKTKLKPNIDKTRNILFYRVKTKFESRNKRL